MGKQNKVAGHGIEWCAAAPGAVIEVLDSNPGSGGLVEGERKRGVVDSAHPMEIIGTQASLAGLLCQTTIWMSFIALIK